MATSVTFAIEDAANDLGWTGFTVDGVVTLANVRTFAQNLSTLSDGALAAVSIKTSQRVDTSAATKGEMECERRGVVKLQHDDGTIKRNYQITIPAISQDYVQPNNPGAPTLTAGACSAVRGYFATLSGIPAAELFVTSSSVYESRR